jgi:hypothetical protein
MQKLGACSFRVALAATVCGISTSSAYAYLDPGTGSILLQVLLGGLAGIALTVRLYWHKLLSMSGLGRQVQESSRSSRERSAEPDERRRERE